MPVWEINLMPKQIKILAPKSGSKEIGQSSLGIVKDGEFGVAGVRDSQDARLKAIVERALRRVDERVRGIMGKHRRRSEQQLTNQEKSDNEFATPKMTRARNDRKPEGSSAKSHVRP